MKTQVTMEDLRKMSAVEILNSFTEKGESKFENVDVNQDWAGERTVITFKDLDNFGVTIHGNDRMFFGPDNI